MCQFLLWLPNGKACSRKRFVHIYSYTLLYVCFFRKLLKLTIIVFCTTELYSSFVPNVYQFWYDGSIDSYINGRNLTLYCTFLSQVLLFYKLLSYIFVDAKFQNPFFDRCFRDFIESADPQRRDPEKLYEATLALRDLPDGGIRLNFILFCFPSTIEILYSDKIVPNRSRIRWFFKQWCCCAASCNSCENWREQRHGRARNRLPGMLFWCIVHDLNFNRIF